MTITEKELQAYLSEHRIRISADRKNEILKIFSSEPEEGFQWSAQDIYEQIRKLVRA